MYESSRRRTLIFKHFTSPVPIITQKSRCTLWCYFRKHVLVKVYLALVTSTPTDLLDLIQSM